MSLEWTVVIIAIFGLSFFVIAFCILGVIANLIVDKITYCRRLKAQEAERDRKIRERWYMSRDEFEDAARVAINLGTMKNFDFLIENEDKLIRVFIEGDKKYHDKD